MGETGGYSTLRELFGGMDACQQAVGGEHVSDIGVYYDPYSPPLEQLMQTHNQNVIDVFTLDERIKMYYVARGF